MLTNIMWLPLAPIPGFCSPQLRPNPPLLESIRFRPKRTELHHQRFALQTKGSIYRILLLRHLRPGHRYHCGKLSPDPGHLGQGLSGQELLFPQAHVAALARGPLPSGRLHPSLDQSLCERNFLGLTWFHKVMLSLESSEILEKNKKVQYQNAEAPFLRLA